MISRSSRSLTHRERPKYQEHEQVDYVVRENRPREDRQGGWIFQAIEDRCPKVKLKMLGL